MVVLVGYVSRLKREKRKEKKVEEGRREERKGEDEMEKA
jgi:hypothetical protein